MPQHVETAADAGAGNRHSSSLARGRPLEGRRVVDTICQRVTAGVSAQLQRDLSDIYARQDAMETDWNNTRATLPSTIRDIVRDELARRQQPAPASPMAAQAQPTAPIHQRPAPASNDVGPIRVRNSRVPATIQAIADVSAIEPTITLRLPCTRRELVAYLQSCMRMSGRCRNPAFVCLSKNLVAGHIIAIKIGGNSGLFQVGEIVRITFTSDVAPHSEFEPCALRYLSAAGALCAIDLQRLSACRISDRDAADLHRVQQIVAQFIYH